MVEINAPSPNYSRRTKPPWMAVLHHTGGTNSLSTLTTKRRIGNVSAHILIQRGKVFRLVKDEYSAWHAGRSRWQGISRYGSVNDFSLGLEIENLGNGRDQFTHTDVDLAAQVVAGWMKKYGISKANVTDHKSVAPGRKSDLASNFPWKYFWQRLDYYIAADNKPIRISIIATPDRAKRINEAVLKLGYAMTFETDKNKNVHLSIIATPERAKRIEAAILKLGYKPYVKVV